MNTIATKNKADFPPAGPTSTDNLEFQNEKLKILLYAILEKKNSPTGKNMNYPLSQYGVGQATINGVKSLTSKAMGLGRTFSRLTGKKSPSQHTGGKKNIDSFKKTDLVKIAKENKINLKNKDKTIKTKEQLYKLLKTKKLI